MVSLTISSRSNPKLTGLISDILLMKSGTEIDELSVSVGISLKIAITATIYLLLYWYKHDGAFQEHLKKGSFAQIELREIMRNSFRNLLFSRRISHNLRNMMK